MRKVWKRISCIFCVCAIMVTNIVVAYAYENTTTLDNVVLSSNISKVEYVTDLNEQAIEDKYDLSIDQVNAIAEDSSTLFSFKSLRKQNFMELAFHKIEGQDDIYRANGSIELNGIKDEFVVSGRMYQVDMDNGELCFAGGLSGYLNNDESTPENNITLSINYNSTTKECNITASVGSAMVLDFGDPLNNASEIFDKVSEQLNAQTLEDNNITSDKNKIVAPQASNSINRIAVASGAWNGYSAAFVSIWGNNSAVYSGNYNIITKTQGRMPQFVAASKVGLKNTGDPYCIVDTIEHAFVDVWNINNSVNDNVRCSSLQPREENHSIPVPIVVSTPWNSVNAIIGAISPLNFKIKGVEHIIGDNLSKKTTVHAWAPNLENMYCSTGMSPYNEKNGFCSIANYVNTQRSSFTFYARGEIQIFYGAVRANGDVISRWKTVPTDTISTTFKTIK